MTVPDPSASPTPAPPRELDDDYAVLEAPEPGQAKRSAPAPTSSPPTGHAPDPEPVAAEDPAALAKRLAAEAKARAAKAKNPEPTKEDPAALAKRLAAEAKARAAKAKNPESTKEDPATLARRLAAEAKTRAQRGASSSAASTPAPKTDAAKGKEPSRLSNVQIPRVSKRKSAAELLEEARQREATKPSKEAKASAKKAKSASQPPQRAEPLPDAPRAASAVLPSAELVGEPLPIASGVAFRAVWEAHLARARVSNDLGLAVTAASLIAAYDRLGAEGIAVATLRLDDTEHALWIDLSTGAPLATATPAPLYLAGS
ncbi:MAG: hypothetical protein EA397_03535 [Deltaproteobacteria bacterium]|nr:MAG: hypothetical protein EA397_03535 [Deltaproteobacteria bacterium]